MRLQAFLFLMALATGCAHDPYRLEGTWHSDRDATVAEAFRRDPGWADAPPEKRAAFSEIFGKLTVSYSGNSITTRYGTNVTTFGYKVVSRGCDYVIIHYDQGLDAGNDIRIQFVDDGKGYWVSGGVISLGMKEKFDKVSDHP